MPPKSVHLHAYRIALSQARGRVPCRHCGASVLPKIFERHAAHFHRFDPRAGCVWCEKVFWKVSEKEDHARHLLACFEAVRLPAAPPLAPTLVPRTLSLQHRYRDRVTPQTELVHPLPTGISHLFDGDYLLNAVKLLAYSELRDTHDFPFVTVEGAEMERLVQVLNGPKNKTRVIAFSVWWDEDHCRKGYRIHRHMLLASPFGHFEKHTRRKVKLFIEDCTLLHPSPEKMGLEKEKAGRGKGGKRRKKKKGGREEDVCCVA